MSKSVKLVFGFLSLLVLFLAAGCDGECSTCVADPFAKQDSSGAWVAKPTAKPAEKAVETVKTKVIYASNSFDSAVTGAPTGKTLIETISKNASAKALSDFGERCIRFNGSVEPTPQLSTIGCYK